MRPLLLVLAACALPGADLVLVANPDHAGIHLSRRDVADIYSGRMLRWTDGAGILPAYLVAGPLHDAFLREYVDKTESQFIATWKRLVFTGKTSMPDAMTSEAEMIAHIRSTPGALGYVAKGTSTEGMAVITME